MSYFRLAEQEAHFNLTGNAPHDLSVCSTWPYYTTRLLRSAGFEERARFAPEDGGMELQGSFDLSEFAWVRFRKQLADSLGEEYARRVAELGETKVTYTQYRSGPNERELVISVFATDPFWVHVSTDMALWVARMDAHPYATLVAEQVYNMDEPTAWRQYVIPRALLSIRRTRPQLTDEQRQQLRDRLLSYQR